MHDGQVNVGQVALAHREQSRRVSSCSRRPTRHLSTRDLGAVPLVAAVNRYYDPASYQFLSIDPKVATTMQPYAFVGGDPLNSTDPLGMDGTALALESALGGETADDWNPTGWIASAVTAAALGAYEGYEHRGSVTGLLHSAKPASPTVGEVLRGKYGSITRQRLPKGSPSWDSIRDKTMEEIEKAADRNEPGYRTIRKLLNNREYDRKK
jgi:RHS repeat-associated protein